MIRLFVLVGIVGGLFVAYLTVFAVSPETQLSQTVSLLKQFEAAGVVPGPNEVVENEEIEHGVFEVPPEDEHQLEMAMKNSGMNMGGMNMGGGNASKMPAGDTGKMPMAADGKPAMKMDGDDAGEMPAGDTGKMPMAADGKPAMKMDGDGSGQMAKEDAGGHSGKDMGGDEEDSGGLKFSEKGDFDREINLTMAEWRFSDKKLEVKSGERIRFNITNGGKIPHEFMFMTMPAMSAVNYRARRADWNLLEHEALFEKSLVLPGGSFSFVVEVKEDGAWMFMCMLPYHMKLGMMGQMATPGRAMDMPM